MRTLRHFLSVTVLTLMLVTAAHAGDMHTTITPPDGASATTEGDIHTGRAGDISTMGTVVALSLVQSVLSLL